MKKTFKNQYQKVLSKAVSTLLDLQMSEKREEVLRRAFRRHAGKEIFAERQATTFRGASFESYRLVDNNPAIDDLCAEAKKRNVTLRLAFPGQPLTPDKKNPGRVNVALIHDGKGRLKTSKIISLG